MRLLSRFSAVAGVVLLCAVAPALSAEMVEISGLHLCCEGCVSAVEEALGDVVGISAIEVDQQARTATFSADDAEAVEGAGAALLNAGFFGDLKKASETSPLKLPENAQISAGTEADRAVFDNVHLCCKSCTRGVTKSLADLKAVVAVDCDIKAHTVTLTGKDMDLSAVLEALHAGGFHGTLRRDSADNTAGARKAKSR
jgi:copper chaperone CopZ